MQKELQPPTILEILGIIEDEYVDENIVWQKYLNKTPIFSDINLTLLKSDGYQLEINK